MCDLNSCKGCEKLNKLQTSLSLTLEIDGEKVIEVNSLTNISMLTVRALCLFHRHGENHIVSKYNIKDYVWQRPVTDNNLTYTIHKCRNVLRESKTEFDVVNIRGFGYCLMNINFVGGNIG